jgi:poly(A) polymerase
MTEPRVVPRAEHTLSRRDIDPDALKVLYRLRQSDHVAYLVGGSVRDLLLGRRPKDFDIGTSAHPYEVKKVFRNCWIIGRRFRLVHVRFGTKVIEVATFRRQVQPGEEIAQDGVPAPIPHTAHHDNTFGTPEEDAFRRDFTINALFYDIATFSIIDYTGGLDDLRAGIVRSIGDPEVRFHEDPVRMLRAVALAARLDFAIDPPITAAIRTMRHELATSSPARLIEEYYKILRAGASEKTFRMLAAVGLLEPIAPELHRAAGDALWASLARLDLYRARFDAATEAFTNAVLLGTLLVPTGLLPQPGRSEGKEGHSGPPKLGLLPLARRDVEHLRHVLSMQRRLHEPSASPRAQRGLLHRTSFADALTWLEIHGRAPEVVPHWRALQAERPSDAAASAPEGEHVRPRRRRRRRRRIRPTPG